MKEYKSYYYVIEKGRSVEIYSTNKPNKNNLASRSFESAKALKEAIEQHREIIYKLENEKQTRA